MGTSSLRSKSLVMAGLAVLATLAFTTAGFADEPGARVIHADWQEPDALPRFLRNHCVSEPGRTYCSDHCGIGYQIYYCSPRAFGCCRAGFGFCDVDGRLRCAP